MPAGLVPRPETTFRNVSAHVLLRSTVEGVFPVVDHAGAVGGQVGDPAGFHHARDHGSEPVLHEMGPVGQHDGRATGSGRAHAVGYFLYLAGLPG